MFSIDMQFRDFLLGNLLESKFKMQVKILMNLIIKHVCKS